MMCIHGDVRMTRERRGGKALQNKGREVSICNCENEVLIKLQKKKKTGTP